MFNEQNRTIRRFSAKSMQAYYELFAVELETDLGSLGVPCWLITVD
jgi:hypothetical protein